MVALPMTSLVEAIGTMPIAAASASSMGSKADRTCFQTHTSPTLPAPDALSQEELLEPERPVTFHYMPSPLPFHMPLPWQMICHSQTTVLDRVGDLGVWGSQTRL